MASTKGTTIVTDGGNPFDGLKFIGYTHVKVRHGTDEWRIATPGTDFVTIGGAVAGDVVNPWQNITRTVTNRLRKFAADRDITGNTRVFDLVSIYAAAVFAEFSIFSVKSG